MSVPAPTSGYTGSNLYNREKLFSLAPPCHPGFSGCNQMEATTPCVQAPTWTSEDNSPPEHLPTSLEYKWSNKHSTLQISLFLPIFLCSVNLFFCTLFCCSSLPLSIQKVCSASTCALLLLCFNLFSYSALHFLFLSFYYTSSLSVILLLCSISFCAFSHLFFLTVLFFFTF